MSLHEDVIVEKYDLFGRKVIERKFSLIKRFVEPGVLPAGVMSDYDEAKNILRIDRQMYNLASERQQRHIWRTLATTTYDQQ